MLHTFVEIRKKMWLDAPYCPAKPLLDYMRSKGELRDAQLEAIETYLFLKLSGENRSLVELFASGFLFEDINLANLPLTEPSRQELAGDRRKLSILQFSLLEEYGRRVMPSLEKAVREHPDEIDAQDIIQNVFYGVTYPDYLFSLPMGAGKTFLIAAFIYIDLYYAIQNPIDPLFAHNFLVLIPSGLKSSISESLKSIERFDPSWILPEPAASEIKRLIHFEILDEQKSGKKTNRARNPNSQKVNQAISQPDPMGLIFLVNAEKVILDRLELSDDQVLIEKTEDEKDRSANELRHLIGKIPRMGIHIDEVHHASSDDVKLRQVVTKWAESGSVVTVCGYTGTPYLQSSTPVQVSPTLTMRLPQISNTVFYYPLTRAIQKFLKKPVIKTAENVDWKEITRRGVRDFFDKYDKTIYADGTTAKLAIYCGTIQRLEEEVYPLLKDELHIPEEQILKFHRGNENFKPPRDSEMEFRRLDSPESKIRIVLLVQIGKEGWDCHSLTGVILAQKNDSPKNMVLQTSCRCLREVDKGAGYSALIWLNEFNYKVMEETLKVEQHTSVREINSLNSEMEALIPRYSRTDYLRLPKVDFYQLRIQYTVTSSSESMQPLQSLVSLQSNLDQFYRAGAEKTSTISSKYQQPLEKGSVKSIDQVKEGLADFKGWLSIIIKESFGRLNHKSLAPYRNQLMAIFSTITFRDDGGLYFNGLYDQEGIRAQIRLAFHNHRTLDVRKEIIPHKAQLLLTNNLTPIKDSKLFPDEVDVQSILKSDSLGQTAIILEQEYEIASREIREKYSQLNLPNLPSLSLPIRSKDRTFHYIPYAFTQSSLERNWLQTCLSLDIFQSLALEVYYNGERGLTEFVISCYEKTTSGWKAVGNYTPDFLIIKRDSTGQAHKILIIETKGKGFEIGFQPRRKFMESEFLQLNRDRFGYDRFDFLFVREDDGDVVWMDQLTHKIRSFFSDPS